MHPPLRKVSLIGKAVVLKTTTRKGFRVRILGFPLDFRVYLREQTHAANLTEGGSRGRVAAQGLLVLGGLRKQDGFGNRPGSNTQNQEAFLLSRKRTFTVHVNIDDMAAMIAGLDGNDEKAEWLDGYLVGVHGHPPRDSWTEAKRLGHGFGAKHFEEVEEFRAEQKRKSDLAEIAKSAKKNPDVTHVVPTGTGSGNPAGDPIQQSNNPLIQQRLS